MSYNDFRIIKKIVNKNFTWGDLNPKYDNIAQLRCNVHCAFHANYDTPSAKFYYDDEEEIWVLHCFSEHKTFTAYDYLDKIICKEWQKYKSPVEFLKEKLGEGEIIRQYKIIESEDLSLLEDKLDQKIEYINNVYDETGNVVDYIERLYCA